MLQILDRCLPLGLASILPEFKTFSHTHGEVSMSQLLRNALGLGKQDRRQRLRMAQYFDCTWSSEWREEQSRVSSLSANGCQIDSRFSVPAEGAVITDLTVALPTGTIRLQGTVVNATPGIGFAVRFEHLDTDTADRLNAFVQASLVQR
jgi:hypothetical protein